MAGAGHATFLLGSTTAPVRAKLAFVETAPNVTKVMPVRFSSDIGSVFINGVKRVQKVSNTPNTPTTQGQALSIKDENVLNNITLTINNPTVINTITPIIGDLVVKRESVFAGVSADIEKAMAKELATPPTVAGGSSSIIQTSATSAQELVIIETKDLLLNNPKLFFQKQNRRKRKIRKKLQKHLKRKIENKNCSC